MTLKSDIDDIASGLSTGWATSQWQSTRTDVPDPDNMSYSEAKSISATFLYADMADSSGLVKVADRAVVATVITAFLKACVKIIRAQDGYVRSFDGDRVMGVFTGPGKQTRAAIAALKINYVVAQVLDPNIQSTFPSIKRAGWHLRHAVGIATSDTLMVRAGIRNNSDLVSVGIGANFAAKLSDIRDSPYRTLIGAATYKNLEQRALIGSDKKNMWHGPYSMAMGGGSYSFYKSSYHWSSL